MIKIYNTLTAELEEFIPRQKDKVSMYVCGPTVYDYIHIGNARPIVFFDVVARYFRDQNYEVKYVSNITDVDDKIIERAQEKDQTENELTTFFTEALLEDNRKLGTSKVERIKATEYITEMIDFIDILIKKGIAYEKAGDVYFDVSKVREYGRLSKQNIELLEVGARIEENMDKKNPVDFTLWKRTDTGIQWTSPWSKGRPGWHTECVSMITEQFGEQIDIHGGGMDLKFPHHENERAQAIGKGWNDLATYWMHNGFVELEEEKMSKSEGNFLRTKDFLEKYSKNATRYWLLSVHYRQPLSYSQTILEEVTGITERMEQSYIDAKVQLQLSGYDVAQDITSGKVFESYEAFLHAMNQDFNTANALSVMHDVFKQLNIQMRHGEKSFGVVAQYLRLIDKMNQILGFEYKAIKVGDEEVTMYQEWKEAKSNKDFESADHIRNELAKRGINAR